MSENYINEIKDEIKDVSKKASDVFSDVKIAMEEEKFYDNFSNKIKATNYFLSSLTSVNSASTTPSSAFCC